MEFRSVLAGGQDRGDDLTKENFPRVLDAYPEKFYWFASKGYLPHVWQAVFHGATTGQHLTRFRHLVAGRRGGKTLSAAWETLFYCLHPAQFHRDAHGRESVRGLWCWILAKDYPTGYASLQTLLDVMAQAGLAKGRDYQYNKTERRIEFLESGSIVQFKTAEDPQSLRGAGLDILWIDEAAFIGNEDAWNVVYPALADKEGLVFTTTTPHGRNWFHKEFFEGVALEDPHEFRVCYTSIDNPYFPREQWERAKLRYHPIMFRQEFLASFDALHGVALQGEWLKFWTAGDADPQADEYSVKHLIDPETGRYRLRVFMGIDPAVSQADTADHFAMAVVGITDDNSQGFLLDYLVERVPFVEQLDLIHEWVLKWRPELVGVESNAFQAALAQQAVRMEGFPGVVPVIAKGKKNDRLLAMSPLFKVGKIRIHRRHSAFLEQWVAFDPGKKNQSDDLLDATEIALGVAGVLLPTDVNRFLLEDTKHTDHSDVSALVKAQIRDQLSGRKEWYDPEMGSEF